MVGEPWGGMIDFDAAYGWLNTFSYSCLGVGTRQLVLQLNDSLQTKKYDKLHSLLGNMTALVENLPYPDEQAECLLACAQAAYRLNALRDASVHLEHAIQIYAGARMAHQRAISTWLWGWALWHMTEQAHYLRGLALLQESVRQFQTLAAVQTLYDRQRAAWYTEKSAALTRTIQAQVQMIDRRGAEMSSAGIAPAAQENPPAVTPTRPSDWKAEYPLDPNTPAQSILPVSGNENLYDFFLQAFEVLDSITAGDPKAMNMDSKPLSHLEIDRVMIDGACFRIVPLKKNGSRTRLTGYLNAGQRVVVLKVKGDSMNRCTPTPILDGDYVLIVLQNMAQDGDIVAAGPGEFDQEATLKRFRPRGPLVDLEPESDNPTHVVQTYPARGAGFSISGVALAVFKPVD